MGLPDFTEDWILPPGLHLATREDVVRRFGDALMSIANDREYGLTRCKLDNVREMIASIERRPPAATSAARSASLRSLRAYENQLAEELVRYVTHSCPEVSVRTIASGAAPDVR